MIIVIRPYVTSIDTDFVNAKVHSHTIGLPNCDRRTDRQTDCRTTSAVRVPLL